MSAPTAEPRSGTRLPGRNDGINAPSPRASLRRAVFPSASESSTAAATSSRNSRRPTPRENPSTVRAFPRTFGMLSESRSGSHPGGRCLRLSYIEIAFPKVERNLIQRALFPLFRLRQPENLAFGIQQGTLPAHEFLIANFDELVHELHSCRVKPNSRGIIAESRTAVLAFSATRKRQLCCLIYPFQTGNLSPRRAEPGLHRAPRLDGLVAGIDLDLAPAHHRAMRDIGLQLDPVREPDRQRAGAKARRRRPQFAPHRIATLAIQHFACPQIALGDRDGVAAEALRLPGRLLAQRCRQHRNIQ